MPLVIQQSEVADRLRRFLGLRGRSPISLDETMVPVVIEADLSQAPYRKEGLSGDMFISKGAVAAEFSYIFWGPHLAACTLIVDQIILTNNNAVAALFQIGYQSSIGGTSMPTTAFSGEMLDDGTSPPPARCAWGMDSGDDALNLIGREILRVELATLETKVFTGPWVVQPFQQMMVKTVVVFQSLVCGIKGRQFQAVDR